MISACGGGGGGDAAQASADDAAERAEATAAGANAESNGGGVSAAASSNASVAGAVTAAHPTLQNITLEWAFTGDANANAKVNVKYRVAGTSAWSKGMPLQRVTAGSTGGYSWATRHSGSLFDLQPGTTYQIQLALKDPDGGAATRTITVSTRSVPVPMAGAPVKRATPSTLAGLINGARPGDIIELGAGSYGNIDVASSGSAGKPIVLRQASGGGAVINGEVYMYQRQHVILDGLRIVGRIRFNDSNFIAITRCNVTATTDRGGIGIVAYLDSEDSYIADNVVTGLTDWNEGALGENGDNLGDGIMVGGPGHVIMNNRVSGFRDNISLLDAGEAANQYSIDILNNDLVGAGDDAIEADFCAHNCRVMRNRVTNALVGVSFQPSRGGPNYAIRNAMYNVVHVAFKLYSGSYGNLLMHNTVVKNGDAFSMFAGAPIGALYTRNNLFIGGPGGVFNGYTSGSGRVLEIGDLVTATANMNRDVLGSTLGTFSGHFGGTAFSGLTQLQDTTTETRSKQTTLGVFAKTVAYPAVPMTSYAAPDLRPKSGSTPQDAGEVIPNVNDGYAGKAPDAGAYEVGAALPVYGPR